jgi:hypothetical protein
MGSCMCNKVPSFRVCFQRTPLEPANKTQEIAYGVLKVRADANAIATPPPFMHALHPRLPVQSKQSDSPCKANRVIPRAKQTEWCCSALLDDYNALDDYSAADAPRADPHRGRAGPDPHQHHRHPRGPRSVKTDPPCLFYIADP